MDPPKGGIYRTLMTAQPLTARKTGPLKGTATVPGDKSQSHRALIFGALSVGETRVEGLLEGADVLATGAALRALGAHVERTGAGAWAVQGVGVGGFSEPAEPLDLGNSGTGARLLMGVIAQQPIRAVMTGDASLRSRPMNRVFDPLRQMGLSVSAREGGRLPASLEGPQRLIPLTYELPVPSAQVKSAVLLAGLAAPGITTVIEPEPTRDHTERMARAFGAKIDVTEEGGRRVIRLTGQPELTPTPVQVAADPSSAAFPLVAALLCEGSDVLVEGVLQNETRTGLFTTLQEMGAALKLTNIRDVAGEPVADMRAQFSTLKGVEVPPERAPSMIDEYPVLAVAAAFAEGATTMRGLAELRVKESDRLSAIADGLRQIGVKVEEGEDWLTVHGTGGAVPGGGVIETRHDHRIAMSFLVAGLAAQNKVKVDDGTMIATSFPTFTELMAGLGAAVEHPNA